MSLTPATHVVNTTAYNKNSPARDSRTHTAAPVPKQPVSPSAPAKAAETAASSESGFSFWDFLDIINPLQHIPIVSSLYRELTGDQISNFSRIAGGALFGGFAGAAVAGVNAALVNETGNDLGELAMAQAGLAEAKPLPAHKQMAQNRGTAPLPDKIPVIEVRPQPQAARSAQQTALHEIIWDAPSLLALATQDTIIWDRTDAPVSATQLADATRARKAEPVGTARPPPHMVRDIAADAYRMPAAMPDAKSLNALEPGNPSSPPVPRAAGDAATPAVPVADTMIQALAKYQAMQQMQGVESASAERSRERFAGLDRSVRRY